MESQLKALVSKTSKLIQNAGDEMLIESNISVIESLEYKLNVPQQDRIINNKIFKQW